MLLSSVLPESPGKGLLLVILTSRPFSGCPFCNPNWKPLASKQNSSSWNIHHVLQLGPDSVGCFGLTMNSQL